MGGKFCFRSKVTDLIFENNTLKEIEINNDKRIPAQVCVLAPGHSARDTFEMLQKRGVYMEPKSFAVGLRIEHPQEMINMDLYGEPENELLGAASYKVTHKCANGRGVYSFCMCPGGVIVPAATGPNQQVVNGMSSSYRNTSWNHFFPLHNPDRDFLQSKIQRLCFFLTDPYLIRHLIAHIIKAVDSKSHHCQQQRSYQTSAINF